MNRWIKRMALGLGAVIGVVLIGGGSYVAAKSAAYEESIAKVYAVPPVDVARSNDPAVVARGRHLVHATAACGSSDCHGADLGGGKPLAMGPVGTFVGPNLTPGGVIDTYSDGELARVVRHGVKKDGRSVRFMPSQDFSWLPDADLTAIVSFLRTVPAVRRDNPSTEVGVLGKVLDRRDEFVVDVARRIDHLAKGDPTPREPSAAYGKLLARMCQGCHGEGFSGGPIPGAPPSTPIPSNLTPHASGLAGWTYEDFDRLLVQGTRKSGAKLDPFMPIEAFGRLDETEKRALFVFLSGLEPRPFGGR
ncbi:MAG: c-type cytochrome [Polyangiaceae bacterium]|nr:c-type cytochrome [Polyangiaceae bacterium]